MCHVRSFSDLCNQFGNQIWPFPFFLFLFAQFWEYGVQTEENTELGNCSSRRWHILGCFNWLEFTCLHFEGRRYWPLSLYVLKIWLGFFRDNCNESDISTNQTSFIECPSQNSQMNQIYTISAVICNFSTFFFGYLMDKWGTWCSRTVACIMITFGSLLLFLSSAEKGYLLVYGMYILSAGTLQLCYQYWTCIISYNLHVYKAELVSWWRICKSGGSFQTTRPL